MKRGFSDRIGPVLSIVSLVVIAVTYGTVASWWNWFPAPQIGLAHRTMLEVSENWKNDIGLEPTRHLVKPVGGDPDPERGLSGTPAGNAADGYILVAGLNETQDGPFHVVRLYDGQGKEVYRWPVHYDLLDSERQPQNVMLHGMEVFEDGSLALTFDGGAAIARVDACGQPIWTQNDRFHHTINRDGEGRLVTLVDDDIVRLDENTGKILSRVSLRKEMVEGENEDQKGMLEIRTRTPENADETVTYLDDPFHPNDAEPLRAEMAGAFPMFEAGDVLLSMRELNMIAVVDPETGRMKWWHFGPWFKQHDPDFQPDGRITVFDNATGTGKSRILAIRPGENKVETLFSGSDELPFYTWRRGKHQILPDGNILLTEAEGGRVLEVSADGKLLWDRHMKWDAEQNVIITEARYVPGDFFENGVPSCNPGHGT
ncbi:arylsulfotransferase family protein [Paracoccus alkanivorans]|uniref:arylsulfotransferase family protein n=1 Tax=Paracoccus alkanivorans TaxID=2116655 RepID=UPI001408E0C6|nr:arylsulfotransferase family protein [Paracoccus alkanivorans]